MGSKVYIPSALLSPKLCPTALFLLEGSHPPSRGPLKAAAAGAQVPWNHRNSWVFIMDDRGCGS